MLAGWSALRRAREAAQERLVVAFRDELEGFGPGPSQASLQHFAKLAVAEQRLSRRLTGRAALDARRAVQAISTSQHASPGDMGAQHPAGLARMGAPAPNLAAASPVLGSA